MASANLAELRAVTYKKRDSWWTVLFVDPFAIHLVRLADRLRWVTPNRITLLAFVVGLASAGAFLAGKPAWLIIGAVLYHLAFVLDCVDGKLARWQKSGSVIGGWLDFTLDQVRLVICALALLGGQYLATRQGVFLLLAAVVVFLNMFRYFNGFLMERALYDLRERLDPAGAANRRAPSISDDDPADQAPALHTPAQPEPEGGQLDGLVPVGDVRADVVADVMADVRAAAATRRSTVGRLRDWLSDRRIRLNIYSGIEYQMVVLIAAPLAGAIASGASGTASGASGTASGASGTEAGGTAVLVVTVFACAVMVAFELAQTGRFLRSARPLVRALAAADPGTDGDVPVQRPANRAESRPTDR